MTTRAIVLGGGGARGPYQIGVWHALREMEYSYSIVTGSSVGALNGALMVQGDYDTARTLWETLTTQDVIAEAPPTDSSASRQALLAVMRHAVEQGGLDITPLENRIHAIISEQRMRQSPIQFGLVTTRYPRFQPVQLLLEEIPQGELVHYLLASSAWFPFFRRQTIDGVDYIDGAYADNLPAELAVRCGAEEIVAVDLQGMGLVHPFRHAIPVRHIRSHWNLGEMLLFDPTLARRNMRLGYQDTRKAFEQLEGSAYAFPLGDTRKNTLLLHRALDEIRRRTGVNLWGMAPALPRIQERLRYWGIDHRFTGRRKRNAAQSSPSLGRAVTTAAEIAGELLQIPPDTIYSLRNFNKLLLHRMLHLDPPLAPGGEALELFSSGDEYNTQQHRRSRVFLRRMHRILKQCYLNNRRVPDAFWGIAAMAPAEFVAVNYLLALEVYYRVLP